MIRQLPAADFLTATIGEISGFRLTEKSWKVLRGDCPVTPRKDPHGGREKKIKAKPALSTMAFADTATAQLWEKLRKLRTEIARELAVPPYIVFNDRTLKEMAACRPDSIDAMLRVNGVGIKKADRFGQRFLDAILDDSQG